MSWDTAATDLRTLLSDGPADKLQAFKDIFGLQNGSPVSAATAGNQTFKTFEFRRVTDFSSTATAFPLGVYFTHNGATSRLPASSIAADDLASGFFQLNGIFPINADKMTATYYTQWFTDTEIVQFLTRGADWLGLGDDYAQVPTGLKTAALKYAASEAYTKLSLMYARQNTETYRLQDQPYDKAPSIVKAYTDAAELALKDAYKARDDFYTKKGKSLSPLFGTISGNIKNPTVG